MGATIIFDFWKIIIRGLAILGSIRLLSTCDISAPASSNDSRPNLQRFRTIITAIRDEYYAKRKKFGLGSSSVSGGGVEGGRGAGGRLAVMDLFHLLA